MARTAWKQTLAHRWALKGVKKLEEGATGFAALHRKQRDICLSAQNLPRAPPLPCWLGLGVQPQPLSQRRQAVGTVAHTQLGVHLRTEDDCGSLGTSDQRLKFLSSSWVVGDFRLLPHWGHGLGAGEFPELPLEDNALV